MLQSQSGIKGTGVNPRGQLVLGSNQRQDQQQGQKAFGKRLRGKEKKQR